MLSVALVACLLLRIVASMYRPRSEKALGSLCLPPQVEVENFVFKLFHSA